MRIKAAEPRLQHEYGVGWRFSFHVEEESMAAARQACDELRDGYLCVTVDTWREQRSLTANAYFHVLCGKLAAKLDTDAQTMKVMLVQRYGTIGRGDDGKYAAVKLPDTVDVEDYFPYVRWFGRSEVGGVTFEHFFLLKPTHALNTEEFSKLLNGTISDCKENGIETLPPRELERMMARYEESQNKGAGDPEKGQGRGVGT